MTVEEIKKYIEDNEENIIDDLERFIKIPSVSSDKENVDKALDYALSLGERMGFTAYSVCDHQVGVIEVGQGDETVGILSHVDVVPPGDLDAWRSDPFQLDIRKGNLYGRGTMDDKGAIVVCLYAMKAVLDSEKPLCKKIQLILGTQEEVAWTDMNEFVKKYPLPDYGFTPDGEFPLCNIEKGILDAQMIFKIDDKTFMDGWYLTRIDGGMATNAVPGKCQGVITHYEKGKIAEEKVITAQGKAVHSCQPEKGENAIFNLASKLSTMNLCPNRLLDILMMIREKFQSIYGSELGLYSKSEMYNGEFVHRNVFAPTVFKTENGKAIIAINVRFAYGTSENEIIDVFNNLAKEYGGGVENISSMPAVYVSKDRPFMKEFADAYEEGSGRKHEFVLAYGGSYAKAMPNIVSWGPIFPGDEDTCHEDNEYISIKSLLDNGKIFAIALSKVVLSDKSYK